MTRTFIETHEFRRRWAELGLTDDDLAALEAYLLDHPEAGAMLEDSGGVRKLRWARPGQGKSGGVRTIYFDSRERATTWLITVFGKNEKANLSAAERHAIRDYVKRLFGGK